MRAGAFLLCALAALCLSACGGGGTSTTSSSTAGAPNKAQGQSRLPGHPRIAAKPTPGHPQAQSTPHPPYTRASAQAAEAKADQRRRKAHRRLARKAGRAAPFLVPTGDNSIPTYGSQASAAEQSQAEAALGAYLGARAQGDWQSACSQMSATVQKQLALLAGEPGATGCPDAYAKLSSRIPAAARTDVLSGSLTALRVKGDQAFALFYGPKGQRYMMPMVSEGGAWKVGQVEAVGWPVGSGGEGGGVG